MKILAIDIETRPATVYTWSLYQPIIGIEQIIDPGGLFCFSAKWLGERKTEFRAEWYDNVSRTGGKEGMIEKLWELLDAADAVVHWNGDSFDVRHIQREFIEAGMKPPSPFKSIDLMKTVKRQARFLSNKFDHVAEQIGMQGKVKHEGFSLWTACMNGDVKAQGRMKRYNLRDTKMLEEAYNILQPWIPNHPSHAALEGDDVCPKCGSQNLQSRGTATTSTGKYPRMQCTDCGAWSRGNKRVGGTTVVQL